MLWCESFSGGEYLMCLMLQDITLWKWKWLWEGLSSQQKMVVNMNDGSGLMEEKESFDEGKSLKKSHSKNDLISIFN